MVSNHDDHLHLRERLTTSPAAAHAVAAPPRAQARAGAASIALEARNVSKAFGGQLALAGADVAVARGTIHALIGENGAGKSTLIKIFAGVHQPDSGEIVVDGDVCQITGPRDARDRGVGFLHQDLHLIPHLTVRENLLLTVGYPRRGSRIDWARVDEIAAEYLPLAGAAVSPRATVASLSGAERQLVAFARVLLQQSQIIFFDEPTASLGDTESRHMLDVLKAQRERGTTIVYVSHRLDEVLELADTVTVLRDGRVVDTVGREGLTRDRLITMLGGIPGEAHAPDLASRADSGTPRLQVRNLAAEDGDRGTSLDLWPGEVLGIAGLVGSGRTRFASMLAGLRPIAHGDIVVDGEPVHAGGVGAALKRGIVLSPESRAAALVADFGVAANVSLGQLDAYSRRGLVVDRQRERDAAQAHVERLRIKGSAERDEVRLLSGGNQQKILLARALERRPKVLVLDEPTAGVDIATKQFIYRLVRELAASGIGIVFISSELDEVSLVADRIVIWRHGPVAELPAGTSRAAIVARLFLESTESQS
jgi:ABC-type sugar transport system ATPase subunit